MCEITEHYSRSTPTILTNNFADWFAIQNIHYIRNFIWNRFALTSLWKLCNHRLGDRRLSAMTLFVTENDQSALKRSLLGPPFLSGNHTIKLDHRWSHYFLIDSAYLSSTDRAEILASWKQKKKLSELKRFLFFFHSIVFVANLGARFATYGRGLRPADRRCLRSDPGSVGFSDILAVCESKREGCAAHNNSLTSC